VKDGVLAPTVSLRAAVPITDGGTVIGTVIVGTDIDNSFVDGVKRATKLDASIYGGNIRTATTFIETNQKIDGLALQKKTQPLKRPCLLMANHILAVVIS